MSVLVKGMKMPENCFECPCCRHDSIDRIKAEQCNLTLDVFGVNNTERRSGRGLNCPLVEVKEPHGRLIDAGKLAGDTIYNPLSAPYITEHMLLDAQTVIEPEGREE